MPRAREGKGREGKERKVKALVIIAMCPGLGIAARWVVFLMLWPALHWVGRVTSDVARGMRIKGFIGDGHITPTRTMREMVESSVTIPTNTVKS